jgi:precorrin-2 dehydrogenase
MRYFPVFLDLHEKPAVVIGGGAVAERKVLALLACGARITVVSPSLTKKLSYLVQAGALRHRKRRWRDADLREAFVVLATTNDPASNAEAARRVRSRAGLINVADDPLRCNFILPSVLTRGDLTIAVSTSGQSPAVARRIRQELERSLGNVYGRYLRTMGEVRGQVQDRVPSIRRRRSIMKGLAASDLLALLQGGKTRQARKRIRRIVGLKGLRLTL